MSSLHSSESLTSVAIPLQNPTYTELIQHEQRTPYISEQLSSITDLDETIKSTKSPKLHMATEVIERYDEGVFDDGITSQTEDDENSVVIADSDDEDEIEHFDSTDSVIGTVENLPIQTNDYLIQTNLDNSNNTSTEGQTVNLGKNFSQTTKSKQILLSIHLDMYEEEVYDNVKSNNENDNNTLRNFSDA